jgi:histidyl-tRNA synthetase
VPEFQTSPGMRDILPPESARWRRFTEVFAAVVGDAGYGQVIPPVLEDIGVFARIGAATDVVTKEMYDFVDKGDRHVALRPEQTASVCRAFVQHHPATPWKVWYAGPNFRYEKPQRGRYRQFDQVGVEVLGVDDPHLDVEVIALAARFYRELGLRRVSLLVNSLGEPQDRARYVEALRSYFGANLADLSETSRQTLERNPLRVLDSKREQDAPVIAAAPRISGYWSDDAAGHFETVQAGLRALELDFTFDESLVRGLDYYRRTTFEFQGATLDSAQNALGGGGRYDGLVEDLGGPPTPGVGFALGLDRTLLACDDEGVFGAPDQTVDVFVVDTTGGRHALQITEALRAEGVPADRAFDNRSMKSQMKAADRSGARLAVIIGSDEVAAGTAVVRPLRDRADQSVVARHDLIPHLCGRARRSCAHDQYLHANPPVRRAPLRAHRPDRQSVRLGRPPSRARRAPRLRRHP